MTTPLAVIAPTIGARSETFIKQHMCDLVPSGTAVIGGPPGPGERDWQVSGPTLDLSLGFPGSSKPPWRALRLLARSTGIEPDLFVGERFMRRNGVEAILGEYLFFSVRWLRVAQKLGVPLVAHAHGTDISFYLRDPVWRRRYLVLAEAQAIVTISETSRRRLTDLGLPSEKIHVVHYGVDVPKNGRKRPPHSQIRCLAVGRLVPKKAPILTLGAFQQAAAEVTGLTLDIVGDGEMMPAVRQFVSRMRLRDRVRILGSLPNNEVHRLMQEADIFLQHSMVDPETGDAEGLPVAILEAMSYALPVVSTRHEGIPEAVIEGSTGLLVDEGDSDAMARAIVLLAKDPVRCEEMGSAGRDRVVQAFSWEKEKDSLLRLLGLSDSIKPTA